MHVGDRLRREEMAGYLPPCTPVDAVGDPAPLSLSIRGVDKPQLAMIPIPNSYWHPFPPTGTLYWCF